MWLPTSSHLSLGLVRLHVAHYQRSVQEALVEADVDYHALPALEDIFHESSSLKPFAGLETEWLQTKYFREELNLLVYKYCLLA